MSSHRMSPVSIARRAAIAAANTQTAALLALCVLGGVLLASLSGSFFSQYNFYVLLTTAAIWGVIGFAQMIVLGVGEFSLAVGGIGAMITMLVGLMMTSLGLPTALVIVVALLAGLLSGLANGLLVAYSRVSGLIVTLATGSIFTGLDYGVTNAWPYSRISSSIDQFGTGHLGFFPYLGFATLLIAVLLFVFITRHPEGRRLLAAGGNRDAADLCGLSPRRSIVVAHMLSGLLAAVAAIQVVGELHSAQPDTGGDWLILSFTVPIIGGTALSGGEVSVSGVLVGALLFAMINNGLVLVNVNQYWVQAVEGLMVFVAVVLARLRWRWTARIMRSPAALAATGPP